MTEGGKNIEKKEREEGREESSTVSEQDTQGRAISSCFLSEYPCGEGGPSAHHSGKQWQAV